VVQFVVDTVGRAELADLQVIEAPHPLFVDAVRSALARYRFSVGEAAGRKVRTRVQIPFEFTLTR
jgi:protein TonB